VRPVPAFIGEQQQFFVMKTLPASSNGGDIGVVILNAGLLHNVGPFRLHVDIAAAVAELGVPVTRIDQSGKGESASRPVSTSLESKLADFDDVTAWIEEDGSRRVILVGLCSGADDALLIARHRSNIAGIVMIDGFAPPTAKSRRMKRSQRYGSIRRAVGSMLRPIRDYLAKRRLGPDDIDIDIRAWTDDADMTAGIAKAIDSGTRFLAIFTPGQDYYLYDGQLRDGLSGLNHPDRLDEVYFDDTDHTFSRSAHRDRVVTCIRDWVRRVAG